MYAVNGPGIRVAESHDGAEDYDRRSLGDEEHNDHVEDTKESEGTRGVDAWAEEPLTGLCVSRNGHLFATMTETSVAIWQTKVCPPPCIVFTY